MLAMRKSILIVIMISVLGRYFPASADSASLLPQKSQYQQAVTGSAAVPFVFALFSPLPLPLSISYFYLPPTVIKHTADTAASLPMDSSAAQYITSQADTDRDQTPSASHPKYTRNALINLLSKTTIDISFLKSDTEFAEAVEKLRNSTNPPLPIIVMWPELRDSSFVEKSTLIGIDAKGSMTVADALKLLLSSIDLGGEKLAYYVDDGLITIAVQSSAVADNRKHMRVYELGEISMPMLYPYLNNPTGRYGSGGTYNNRYGRYGRGSDSYRSVRR